MLFISLLCVSRKLSWVLWYETDWGTNNNQASVTETHPPKKNILTKIITSNQRHSVKGSFNRLFSFLFFCCCFFLRGLPFHWQRPSSISSESPQNEAVNLKWGGKWRVAWLAGERFLLFITGRLFLAAAAGLASRVSRCTDGRFPRHPQVTRRGEAQA